MSDRRWIFHRTATADPALMATEARALLEKGQQVESLGFFLWRCRPNRAGYRQACAFYAPPDRPLPAGWEAGPRRGALQLCYAAAPEAPSPVPSHRVQNEALLTECSSTLRQTVTLAVAVLLLLALRLPELFSAPLFGLADGQALVLSLLVAVLLVLYVARLPGLLRQRNRVRQALLQEAPPPAPPYPSALRRGFAAVVLAATLGLLLCYQPLLRWVLLAAAAALLLAWPLRRRLLARGRSRRFARGVTIALVWGACLAATLGWAAAVLQGVLPLPGYTLPAAHYTVNGRSQAVYDDPLPLTLEALTGEDARWSKRRVVEQSPLLRSTTCTQYALDSTAPQAARLEYQLVDSPLPPVQNAALHFLLSEHQDEPEPDGTVFRDSYQPVDPAPWGAEAVYQRHWSQGVLDEYLVVWPGRIMIITFYWPPTETQIAAAADALRPQ